MWSLTEPHTKSQLWKLEAMRQSKLASSQEEKLILPQVKMERLETANLCLSSDQASYSNGKWDFDLTGSGLEGRVVAWEVVSCSIPQTYFLIHNSFVGGRDGTIVTVTDTGTGISYSNYFSDFYTQQYWTPTALATAFQSFLNTFLGVFGWVGWTVTYDSDTSAFTIANATAFTFNSTQMLTFLGFPTGIMTSTTSATGGAAMLSGGPYLYCLSTKLSSLSSGTFSVLNGKQTGVIGAVPLTGNATGDVTATYFRYNWQPYRNYVNGTIQILDIRWQYANGLDVDFRGAVWALNLIVYLKPN